MNQTPARDTLEWRSPRAHHRHIRRRPLSRHQQSNAMSTRVPFLQRRAWRARTLQITPIHNTTNMDKTRSRSLLRKCRTSDTPNLAADLIPPKWASSGHVSASWPGRA